MKKRSAALSNDAVAGEAAQDFLASGGSAVGAVLAGFFAAAGSAAGILLGPMSILVGGIGVGARAFDGRLRQPGVGSKRPRGFKPDESVPDPARIAVPTSVSAAAVALAYDGQKSFATLLKPSITRAERSGAEGRAAMLRMIRGVGAGAFSDRSFVRALLRVAGPSQGGLLSPADFGQVPDVDVEAATRSIGAVKLLEPPWADGVEGLDVSSLGLGYSVIAVDVRGVFAAISYRRFIDGFPIDELELDAPLVAIPVLRGVTRTSPGARLPAPAPIAIRIDASGTPVEVIAAPGALRLGDADIDKAPLRLRRSTTTQDVEVLRA